MCDCVQLLNLPVSYTLFLSQKLYSYTSSYTYENIYYQIYSLITLKKYYHLRFTYTFALVEKKVCKRKTKRKGFSMKQM